MSLSKQYPYHPDQEEKGQLSSAPEVAADRFLAVVQASADVFWLLTPAGEMQELSPSWHTFTGQTEHAGLGRGWLDAMHPADQPQGAETLIQAVTSGRTSEMKCQIRRYDGVYRLVHLRVIPVRAASGAIYEVVVCGTDITRQELAEQMSEAQVQLAVKTSGVGTWDWDLITNQIMWTDQCKALLGASPSTPIDYEGFLAILHPDDRERVDRLIARALAEHTEYRTEYRAIWPDGSIHWLIDRGKHLYDAHDKPIHMIGAMLDITAMKQAEEQGQAANRQMRAILESITDGFLHVDAQWRFTYVNQRVEEYLEKKREDLLGKSVWDVFPQLHGSSFESHTHHAMATQQVAHFETRQFWRERWFDIHVYPAQGGLSVYLQDITERKGAEEALRESKEELRLLTEAIPQLVWTALPNGFVDCFNEQCTTYLGAKAERLTGEQWIEAVHPDDRHKTRTIWQTALQTGQAYAIEYRLREGKTGDYHWFLERATPLTDEQGHILKWYGTATDIDKNKRTEEALRQSRDAFRLLTEAMPQLVWTARPDGSQEYLNQQWYDYTGSTPEQSLGEGWVSCYHPDDQQRILALWYASLLTSQPFDLEARICQAKTGVYRWFLVRAVPLMNTSGSVWKWFGTCTDIHEQKCTAESLQESEARFRALVESNLIGITIADLEGTILEANEAFLKLVGYTQQDVAAGRVQWTAMTPPEYQERDAQAVEELRTTGMFQPFEKELVTKDGRRVPVLVGRTLFQREKATPLVIGFVLDQTARKEMERRKDLMLGMTSHELKTPLTTLKGTFQLLQRRVKRLGTKADQLSPEVSAFLNDLSERLAASARQVDVQTHLINDLLDVSRISAQTLKLELEPCDLVPIVRETVEDLRVTEPNRSLLLALPEHTKVLVLADRNRISQVVANYVTNALRYSRSDQPVSIGLTLQENTARVWVRDQGPGLTAEAQKDLWQCFHQVKGVPVQSGSGKGLGLGLYICQTLIAGHQGEVGVESTPGEGSTFWFTLPVVT